MTRRSISVVTVFAVLALVVGGAALAWACSAQAGVSASPNTGASGDPSSGQPGTTFTVQGSSFRAGPVEIRWNGADGALIATASGPVFSVSAIVPSGIPAGTYSVTGVQPASGAVASTWFTVTGTAQAAPAESDAVGEDADAPGPTTSKVAGADGRQANAGTPDKPKVGNPGRGTGTTPAASTVTNTAGTEVFAASAGTSSVSSTTGKKAQQVRAGSETAGTLDRIASAERMYSGLESPAVLPSPFDSAAGSQSTSALTVGVALLSAGLIAMFAGVLVAEARRRRVAHAARRK